MIELHSTRKHNFLSSFHPNHLNRFQSTRQFNRGICQSLGQLLLEIPSDFHQRLNDTPTISFRSDALGARSDSANRIGIPQYNSKASREHIASSMPLQAPEDGTTTIQNVPALSLSNKCQHGWAHGRRYDCCTWSACHPENPEILNTPLVEVESFKAIIFL